VAARERRRAHGFQVRMGAKGVFLVGHDFPSMASRTGSGAHV
jgi:hypothetical protein